MVWRRFDELNPAQSVVALKQLQNHVLAPNDPLLRPSAREFLVVDDQVRGSRLATSQTKRLMLAIFGPSNVPSKGSLHGWTGGPRRWHLNNP